MKLHAKQMDIFTVANGNVQSPHDNQQQMPDQ